MPTALAIGQSKYTFFLNEQAGIIDDLIVTRLGDERFMVVANAGNAAEDEAHLAHSRRRLRRTVEAARPRVPGDPGAGSGGVLAARRHRDGHAAPS